MKCTFCLAKPAALRVLRWSFRDAVLVHCLGLFASGKEDEPNREGIREREETERSGSVCGQTTRFFAVVSSLDIWLSSLQVKKGDEPKKPTRKQVAKTRFVKAGGGLEA